MVGVVDYCGEALVLCALTLAWPPPSLHGQQKGYTADIWIGRDPGRVCASGYCRSHDGTTESSSCHLRRFVWRWYLRLAVLPVGPGSFVPEVLRYWHLTLVFDVLLSFSVRYITASSPVVGSPRRCRSAAPEPSILF